MTGSATKVHADSSWRELYLRLQNYAANPGRAEQLTLSDAFCDYDGQETNAKIRTNIRKII